MSLPKVLILGPTFNDYTGGGITLSNLFKGWDESKIAVASTGHELSKKLSTDICNTYYQLGNAEYKWIFPFNHLQRNFPSGPLAFAKKAADNNVVKTRSGFRRKFVHQFFFPALRYAGLYYFISKLQLSLQFKQWLSAYQPDILYVQLLDRQQIPFAQQLQAFLNIPVVVHFMDDWPSWVSDKGLLKKYWRKKIDAELSNLLANVSLRLSISDDMAREYERRYGQGFITFHNPIDSQFWKRYQRSDYKLGKQITLLYAGRIGIGIDRSLETIARAVEQLNKRRDIAVKFVLQTKEMPKWVDNYPCTIHQDFVAYDDLPKVFAEADLLILPYDFSRKAHKYIKYSMPTKAPEYMMSGTPVVIFGPEETAVIKYARKYNCAKIVTENNINALAVAITELINNEPSRIQLAENAKMVAAKYHDALDIRKNFRQLMAALVAKPVISKVIDY